MKQVLLDESLEQFPLPIDELPEGWSVAVLADVAYDIAPGFASGKHDSEGKGHPHMRPMNIDRNGKVDLAVVKSVPSTEGRTLFKGDVLFNNTNSPDLVGKTALIGEREAGFAFSNHMTRVRVDESASPGYVAHYLHFLWVSGYMKHRCTSHVNQASISSKTLAQAVPLLVPPSDEQVRIVEKLEELLSDLDAGVAELKVAQRKLAQYRQSLLKAAAEGALTADWRATHGKPQEPGAELLQRILSERRARWEQKQLTKFAEQGKVPPKGWQTAYVEPDAPNFSGLLPVPEGWEWATAEMLCEFITKGTTPPKSLDDASVKTVPFLRVTNLTNTGELDFSDRVFVSSGVHEDFLARSIVYPNDVLMNIVGPPLGQVSIVPSDFEEWNVNQAIAIFRAVDGVLPAFVAAYLLSPMAQRWLKQRAKTTAGQTNLTLEVCRQLPVPVPPMLEQLAVIEQLDAQLASLSAQLDAVDLSLKQAAAQRKNLLKAAFAGQLVPQDPNDEPASDLLARIRAERASNDGSAPRRRRKTA